MLNDNIDLLWWVIWCFFMANVRCSMCKGDVSNAYKRLPVWHEHHQFVWVVWPFEGELWASCLRALPFGAVGSCYGWHQVASLLRSFLRRVCWIPALKYVDDFFCASVFNVKWDMSRCLTIIAGALGVPLESSKTQCFMDAMVILGLKVTLIWERKGMRLELPLENAA